MRMIRIPFRTPVLVLLAALTQANGPALAGAAEESRTAALLRQMGAITLLEEPRDALLEKELEMILAYGRRDPGARLSGLADQALRAALARREAYITVVRPELDRFIELEKELLAAKPPATAAELVAAIHKNAKSPLFVLTVARILHDLHGENAIQPVLAALNQVDASEFPSELFALATGLAGSAFRKELVPFFSKVLAIRVQVPYGEKGMLSPDQARLIVLAGAGEAGESAVLKNLASKNPLMRRNAIGLAGALLSRAARDELRKISPGSKDESDPLAQLHALRSLSLLLDYESVGAIEALAASPLPELRAAVVSALGELARPRSVERILAAADDPHFLVREAAIMAMSRYVDQESVVKRLALLTEKEPLSAIRQDAIAALAGSPLRSATAALELLHKTVGNEVTLRKAVESAMQEQILHVTRGTIAPQFSFRNEKGEVLTKASVPDASARLRQAVLTEQRFSAPFIAGLAPGLGSGDLPTLFKARELLARYAKLEVVLKELDAINAVIRSIYSRQ